MQKGILPVIKSENEHRLKENLDAMNGLFDESQDGVKLTHEDILTIDGLNKSQNIFAGWYNML